MPNIKALEDMPFPTMKSFEIQFLAVLTIGLVCGGCSDGPSRVAAPDWDPGTAADRAIETLDIDGDGFLSSQELDAAPGLKYCADEVDSDKDSLLSHQEIYDHVEIYRDMRIGLIPFSCDLTLNGRPLAGAEVKLVPESFLGDVTESAVGITGRGGRVSFVAESSDLPAARVGMYRVEVNSSKVKIPKMYNTETELGVEVPSLVDPNRTTVVFRLKSP